MGILSGNVGSPEGVKVSPEVDGGGVCRGGDRERERERLRSRSERNQLRLY